MIHITRNDKQKYALKGAASFAELDTFLAICIEGMTANEVFLDTEALGDDAATIRAALERKGITVFDELPEAEQQGDLAQTTETCPRCDGSGHYSYNALHGSVCYGCQGKGWVPMKPAKQKRRKTVEPKDAKIGSYIKYGKVVYRVDGWLESDEGFTKAAMGPFGKEYEYYRRALLLTRDVDNTTMRLLVDRFAIRPVNV